MPVAAGEVGIDRRARRFALADWRRRNATRLGSKGAASCMKAYGDVNVSVSGEGRAHIESGVGRCGSISACPVCAPVMRERRAAEIDEACRAHVRGGGSVWLLTLTVPHRRGESLDQVLDRVKTAWSRTWSGRSGVALRKSVGIVGMVRAFDFTYGENGWHPHLHVLVFTRAGASLAGIADAWSARFGEAGLQFVPGVSVDWRPVKVGEEDQAGGYVAKVEGGWGAGLELARADLKRGSGLGPQAVLELASTGEAQWVRLWAEYEAATRGLRVIQWTPGLRAELGLSGIASDEEAAKGEEPEVVVGRFVMTRTAWNEARERGGLSEVLACCEAGRELAGLRLLDSG